VPPACADLKRCVASPDDARHRRRAGGGAGDPVRRRGDRRDPSGIPVRGGRTTLTRRKPVGVHRKAHGTTRLTPFEASRPEIAVQSFGLGLLLDEARAGDDDPPADVVGLLPPFQHRRGGAQIFYAAVGTAADEDVLEHGLELARRSGRDDEATPRRE